MMSSALRNLFRSLLIGGRAFRHDLVALNSQYWVRRPDRRGGTVVDCGAGDHPDFSLAMIARFGMSAHVFDPTRKHQATLADFAAKSEGRLRIHPVAVAPESGETTFFESTENVSGSMLDDHVNVRSGGTSRYAVPALSLAELLSLPELGPVRVLKLDIEGAEYEVLAATPDNVFSGLEQLVIEFHHYCLEHYTVADTQSAVARLKGLGFKCFSHDRKTWVFYRK